MKCCMLSYFCLAALMKPGRNLLFSGLEVGQSESKVPADQGPREETLAAALTAFGGFVFPRWRNKQDPLGLHLYGTGLAGEASVLDATRCSTVPSKWEQDYISTQGFQRNKNAHRTAMTPHTWSLGARKASSPDSTPLWIRSLSFHLISYLKIAELTESLRFLRRRVSGRKCSYCALVP